MSVKAVLDTNVVVSGLLSGQGPPGQLLGLAASGQLTLAYDARLWAEYLDVLARPELEIRPEEAHAILEVIEENGCLLTPPPWFHPLPDPDDEAPLAVASAAGCPLVTGNLRHFPAELRGGVQVMKPGEFLAFLRAGGGEGGEPGTIQQ